MNRASGFAVVVATVCLMVLPSSAVVGGPDKIRVYVFTATAGPEEFVGLDEHPRTDSVEDLRRALRYGRRVKVVEKREDADLTLEILGRDRVADGGSVGAAVPIFGGAVFGGAVPTQKAVVWVRLAVVGRDYRIDVVGEAGGWGAAADKAAEQIERWAKENYDRLRPAKDPR